jgi:hypothetical protein
MAGAPLELREIPYLRLFPWIRLFRAVRLALDAKKLILAAIGLGLFWAGGSLFDILFPAGVSTATVPATLPLPSPFDSGQGLSQAVAAAAMRVTDPALTFLRPFLEFFAVPPAPGEFWHGLLSGLWAVVVWGLIGGAIARIAVVQVATGDRVPISQALMYALRHGLALVTAPITPFLGVAFFAVPCALLGLGYRINHPLALSILGLFAFLPLLSGLAMTVILTALATGWPLMHAAIAAEGEDAFDAISRSYAYVFQRPARYAAYTALAWLLGIIGVLLVGVLTRVVVGLALWALSFGAPDTLLVALFQGGRGAEGAVAEAIHSGWYNLVWMLGYGWVYSYFWTSAAIIYLLLRHDVDGTDWHDLGAMPAPSAEAPAGAGAIDASAAEPRAAQDGAPAAASPAEPSTPLPPA